MNNTNDAEYKSAGLFCRLKNATVENLVIDSSCSFNGSSVGALSVLVSGQFNAANITNYATVNGAEIVGGFIGEVSTSGQTSFVSVRECVNKGNVDGSGSYVGGFVGVISDGTYTTFSKCVNNGTVTGGIYYAGGFIGFFWSWNHFND